MAVSFCCTKGWTNMWPYLAHFKKISEFKCSGRLFPVWLISENAIFHSCCLVQGKHALQRSVLPGQHGHVLDQSGREGKTGGTGRRAGSSESAESRPPPTPHPVTHHKVPEAAALCCRGGKCCTRISMWPTHPALASVNWKISQLVIWIPFPVQENVLFHTWSCDLRFEFKRCA